MRMIQLVWVLSALVVALTSRPVYGYFSTPNILVRLPFKDMMATASRNNTMILFGGANATHLYTNDLYQLTATSTGFEWDVLPQNNPPPPVAKAQGVYVEKSDSFVILGGNTATTANQTAPLQVYVYYFSNQTWVAAPTNTLVNATGVPINRFQHSVAIDQQSATIFLYGGAFNSTPFNDFWALDTTTMAFIQLPPTANVGHYGHAMSLLSTGKLVVTGGVRIVADPTTGQALSSLASLESLYVFDLTTGVWTVQNTTLSSGTTYPSTRSDHIAAVTSGDNIVIFGGDNSQPVRTRAYTNSVGILSPDWVWTNAVVGGIAPSRRAYASGAILDGQHLTVAFGANVGQYFNDINVLDLEHLTWLQSYDPNQFTPPSRKLSGGVIAAITVSVVIFVALVLFLLWRFRDYIKWLLIRVHRDIWSPRAGEPLWAETARFCCEIFMVFLFALCLAFIIRQAISSPDVIQRTIVPVAQVDVPDVRVCLDGYEDIYPFTDSRNVTVTCTTDTGFSCTDYVTKLDHSVFQPVFVDHLGPLTCFLFRAPSDFQLSKTSGQNNGSRLLFSAFGDSSITNARIHVSAYPKAMNPNVRVYNITDDIPFLLTDEAVSNWIINAQSDLEATNIFTIAPFTYSVMTYNLVDHRYLQDVGWNYVGFLPNSNHTPQIETNFRQEAPNPDYPLTHEDLGYIVVYPETFGIITDREVKVYTLLNALGFIGGIFGILFAVQTWLFGYRPRSPWGVVQRWSVGNMRESLLRGLNNKFRSSPEAGIPLIHPVHRRFSLLYDGSRPKEAVPVLESEEERIGRVEERMQVLELLFKAYYVNDEVFRSLDNARGGQQVDRVRRRRTPQDPEHGEDGDLYTPLRKPQDNSANNSHLFNERQPSLATSSSDAMSDASNKKLAPKNTQN